MMLAQIARPFRFLGAALLMLAAFTLFSVSRCAGQQVSEEAVARINEALPDKAPATPRQERHVLIYSCTLGFRHGSIPTGAKAFQMMGQRTRAYTAVHTEDPSVFDEDNLDRFDAVVMLNTTGDCFAPHKGDLSADERQQMERRKENFHKFVAGGKGLVGVHSATDTFYSWKVYGDMIGGWFTSHPWHEQVWLKVDSPGHPLTQMFDADEGFRVLDEIYMFAPRSNSSQFDGYQPYSRDKLRVLLSLDGAKFDVSRGQRPDQDYAISWIRNYEKGRVFYSVLGHNDHIFWNPTVLQHYLAGLQFAMGDLEADATPSGK